MLISKRFYLSREKLLGFLDELASANAARSLYIPCGISLSEIDRLVHDPPDTQVIPEDLPRLAASSATGAVAFWGGQRSCLVLPPFPITERHTADGYDTEPLRALLKRDFRIALFLVRLGSYAVGLCQSESLISSKVGTGLVHGRHKKGGSSQQRFQRHREKQIEAFLGRVCGHIQEQLGSQARTLDYVVYGGARTTILLLQKRCSFLQQFDNRTLTPLLDIPDPRKVVLEAAVGRVWSSSVVEWYDDGSLT